MSGQSLTNTCHKIVSARAACVTSSDVRAHIADISQICGRSPCLRARGLRHPRKRHRKIFTSVLQKFDRFAFHRYPTSKISTVRPRGPDTMLVRGWRQGVLFPTFRLSPFKYYICLMVGKVEKAIWRGRCAQIIIWPK